MDVRFRQMRLGDVIYSSLMEQRYFDDCVKMSSGFLAHLYDSRFSFVCEVEGRIVGVCTVERHHELCSQEMLISSVCVESSHRRLGIARKLLQLAINSIHRVLGREARISLMVSTRNSAAISLYESIGFRIQRVTERAYFDGSDGYIMSLTSTPCG